MCESCIEEAGLFDQRKAQKALEDAGGMTLFQQLGAVMRSSEWEKMLFKSIVSAESAVAKELINQGRSLRCVSASLKRRQSHLGEKAVLMIEKEVMKSIDK